MCLFYFAFILFCFYSYFLIFILFYFIIFFLFVLSLFGHIIIIQLQIQESPSSIFTIKPTRNQYQACILSPLTPQAQAQALLTS